MAAIPDEILDAVVAGANLVPGRLRDQLGDGPTLLVFLRHFGCVFCQEMVADLRKATEARADYPPVLFFHQGTSTAGRLFLRRFWPTARAVSDPERRFYAAFGVSRGGLVRMFGPGVWPARRRALAKGISQGARAGDVWMMPGIFWVERERVVWSHEFAHAGDHPDFPRIPELAREGS